MWLLTYTCNQWTICTLSLFHNCKFTIIIQIQFVNQVETAYTGRTKCGSIQSMHQICWSSTDVSGEVPRWPDHHTTSVETSSADIPTCNNRTHYITSLESDVDQPAHVSCNNCSASVHQAQSSFMGQILLRGLKDFPLMLSSQRSSSSALTFLAYSTGWQMWGEIWLMIMMTWQQEIKVLIALGTILNAKSRKVKGMHAALHEHDAYG